MSACSQCGTVAKATDKFCNVCGTPLARAAADSPPSPPAAGGWPNPGAPPPAAPPYPGAPPPAGFGPPPGQGGFGPPPGQGGFGPPPAGGGFPPPSPGGGFPPPGAPQFGSPGGSPARCQAGHEILPGASYCAQGHPIALEQMQFSNNDPYGAGAPQGFAPSPGFGQPPRQAPGGFGPPPGPPPFGGPAPSPSPGLGGGYGPPPAAPPQAGYPPAAAPQFGAQTGPGGYPPPAAAPGYPPPASPYGGGPGYAPEAAAVPVPPKMLRGFLVSYTSNPAGEFWPLTGGRLVIGRVGGAEGTDITMQDPTISSRHAAILVDGSSGSIVVEDTGSTNGTFVNDEHIGFNGRRDLRDGDRLRFGGYTTVVKVIGRV